ncbi:hypothetical protein LCGC14_2926620, partial [marine sediment metagenome]
VQAGDFIELGYRRGHLTMRNEHCVGLALWNASVPIGR